MSLPFFRALNPTSTQSGIEYVLVKKAYETNTSGFKLSKDSTGIIESSYNKTTHYKQVRNDSGQHTEMIDEILVESINKLINSELNIIEGIMSYCQKWCTALGGVSV